MTNVDVAKLKAGDESAFNEFFTDSLPRLRNYLRAFLQAKGVSQIEAEDLLQQVVLRTVENRHRIKAQDSVEFSRWVLLVARNIANEYVRTARRERRVGESLDSQPPKAVPEDMTLAVKEALAQLKPAQQEILKLHFFMGLSANEVAERLEIPVGKVLVRLTQAKRDLIELLTASTRGNQHEG